MKKTFLLVISLMLVLAGAASAAIVGSAHDIASGACVACHTPHGSVSSTNGPLWNRSQDTQAYQVYASATFDMDTVAPTIDAPQTVACMTCHNGVASTVVNAPGPGTTAGTAWDSTTVAAGAALGFAGTTNTFANIGLDLRNDHPVGFTYNETLDTTNGFPTAAVLATAGLPMYAGKMECATCHDVHGTAQPTRVPVYFLRVSNTNSAMCVLCHTAK